MKRIVIGILAHVDSGKTTLSEAMLYNTGEIRSLGRVDHKNAFLDTHEIERNRGITIFSKQAVIKLDNTEITLLDTPGHVDFSTETERTLRVLDYAVLVVSGSEGVQSHTETLWKLLIRYNVPVFIFVNKMDLSDKSADEITASLCSDLSEHCIRFDDENQNDSFFENIAMCDEKLMDKFLSENEITDEDIADAVKDRKLFPCYFGSALKLDGVDRLISGIAKYSKSANSDSGFGARIYKISEDEKGNRLTHMKITGGTLKTRDLLSSGKDSKEEWSEKVNQIRIYSGSKFTAVDEAYAGTVCAVTGLSHTQAGDGLGNEENALSPVLEPVLTYRIIPPSNIAPHTALFNLRRLEEEEPQLRIIWNEQLQEIHIQLMGEVQLDIVKTLVKDRFGFDVEFGQGSITYKETIAEPVEGVGHYEPLRHYAEVHVLLEPLERGSGLKFALDCSEDELAKNWQRLIYTHFEEKTHIGVLTGSPITDMKITLVAGKAHQKHTEGGDFRQATYRAIRQGLKSAKSILLEPWYEFRLEIPQDNIGRAMTDVQQMGGTVSQPETKGDFAVITGTAPVSVMREYHTTVTSYTGGRGKLYCSVKGYYPCHNSDKVIADIGYDSDADIENTADSVFCTHGAGFVVKWDEVADYMHIDSGLSFGLKGNEDTQLTVRAVEDYIKNISTDSELLKIFERTYGPVKQKMHTALTTKKSAPANRTGKVRPMPTGPEYLLVDGYNIIFAWDNLKNIAKDSLEQARTELIDILCNYRGFRECELILVFDAYKVKGNKGEVEKMHNITVVYTKEAETADMYIEKVTHEIGRKHRVRVATSDNLEQMIILGNGAVRISADAFRREINSVEEEIRSIINRKLFD